MSTVTAAVTPQQVGYVLTLDCPEAPGLVHAVSGFLMEQHGDIHELKQFDDVRGGHFFLRVHFAISDDQADPGVEALRDAFAVVAGRHGMRFELREASAKRRVLVMVSKFAHCLNDLLFRSRVGELPMEIAAVVSNH
ncbi:MAG: formyltetrahydrofolate deformylase, partial [Dermatophilaceae bacterium]|nr:formyltetrahydrofolate deformylase [Dermatophilaceae bacterium]